MPELPDVEPVRVKLEETCLGMRVSAVNALEQGGGAREGQFDDRVIAEGMTAESLTSKLVGKWVVGSRRRGKQLWLELGESQDAEPTSNLLIHMGMTGALTFRDDTSEWPPKHTKLEMTLEGDAGSRTLAYSDSRRFGRVLWREGDATSSPPISDLASDPILDPPSVEDFCEKLRATKVPVKTALMDQSRLVCGVGNWVADEVLYHARIAPTAPSDTLSDEQARALHGAVLEVCKVACEAGGESARYPQSWLVHHRSEKHKAGSSVNSPLGKVHFESIGGRSTAFVPEVQKGGTEASRGGKGKGKSTPKTEGGDEPPGKKQHTKGG